MKTYFRLIVQTMLLCSLATYAAPMEYQLDKVMGERDMTTSHPYSTEPMKFCKNVARAMQTGQAA